MKTFITFSPQQKEGFLHSSSYVPQGNTKLQYGSTRFPIMTAINGYTNPGEEIRVIVICQDYEWCRHNLNYLRQELEALFAEKGLRSAAPNGDLYELVEVAYDDAVSSHLDTFQKLIDVIHDGDDIHACITYGSKPAPMVEMMALRYARQFKKDIYISCIVYGQFDHTAKESRIYDETALVHLDDIVRVLAQTGAPNPGQVLKNIIGM